MNTLIFRPNITYLSRDGSLTKEFVEFNFGNEIEIQSKIIKIISLKDDLKNHCFKEYSSRYYYVIESELSCVFICKKCNIDIDISLIPKKKPGKDRLDYILSNMSCEEIVIKKIIE